MPVIQSTYNSKYLFKKGHFSTIYSGLVRHVDRVNYKRERLELADGDFVDLDWSYAAQPSSKLIIILHGLGGDASRPYVKATAKQFNANGYDCCALNFRGCSGEDNRLWRTYHSGDTEDVATVISHCISKNYDAIYLKGFSLGGNVLLKYLGEGRELASSIKGAVAVSVPCDLHSSCEQLHKLENRLYHDRFKRHLLERLRQKQAIHLNNITDAEITSIKTLKDFDDVYTSKAHGFIDALDYYEKSSSRQFLPNIHVPTLLINALNDSFLGTACFPVKEAKESSNLYLEMPKQGGHVGFYKRDNVYYNEQRALEFISTI